MAATETDWIDQVALLQRLCSNMSNLIEATNELLARLHDDMKFRRSTSAPTPAVSVGIAALPNELYGDKPTSLPLELVTDASTARRKVAEAPRGKRHWTEQEQSQVITMWVRGVPTKKIADHLGRTTAGVARFIADLRTSGVDLPKRDNQGRNIR